LNNRLSDIQDQLKIKQVKQSPQYAVNSTDNQEEKDYYDDLSTELELADDDEPVLYRMGEAFFYLSLIAAKKQLRADTKRYDREIGALNEKVEECEKGMKELKVLL